MRIDEPWDLNLFDPTDQKYKYYAKTCTHLLILTRKTTAIRIANSNRTAATLRAAPTDNAIFSVRIKYDYSPQ